LIVALIAPASPLPAQDRMDACQANPIEAVLGSLLASGHKRDCARSRRLNHWMGGFGTTAKPPGDALAAVRAARGMVCGID